MATKTNFQEFNSAKRSVAGRLDRLRKTRGYMGRTKDSPIKRIGCFDDEIDSMERTLKSMANRLENATIKIPD